MSRLYLWFALCTFFCTGTAGASRHPAFPAPSVSRGHDESASLGRVRAASTSTHIRCLKIPSKSEANPKHVFAKRRLGLAPRCPPEPEAVDRLLYRSSRPSANGGGRQKAAPQSQSGAFCNGGKQ
jgi:hypothetical protein